MTKLIRIRQFLLAFALTFGFAGAVSATPLAASALAVANDRGVELATYGYGYRHHGGHRYGYRHHGGHRYGYRHHRGHHYGYRHHRGRHYSYRPARHYGSYMYYRGHHRYYR